MTAPCPTCGRAIPDGWERARKIIAQHAEAQGVTVEQVLGSTRVPAALRARHGAMREAARALGVGTRELGLIFNREESAVRHALRKLA